MATENYNNSYSDPEFCNNFETVDDGSYPKEELDSQCASVAYERALVAQMPDCTRSSSPTPIILDESMIPPSLINALLRQSSNKRRESLGQVFSENSSRVDSQSRPRCVSDFNERRLTFDQQPNPPISRPPVNFILHSTGSSARRDTFSDKKASDLGAQLATSHYETIDLTPSYSYQKHVSDLLPPRSDCTTTNENRQLKFYELFRRHMLTVALILGGAALILTLAFVTCYLLLSKSSNLPSVTSPPYNETYDCVNGSIATVNLDGSPYKLIDLHLPEKPPTLTALGHEYLFVFNRATWWYALKYCTAWCGYLVSVQDKQENNLVLDMVRSQQTQYFNNYWIGFKGWKGGWYLDDESTVHYSNFADKKLADQTIINVDFEGGCVKADINGLWSTSLCRADSLPFVCERNTADENIIRTPFFPHQERKCANISGTCKYASDCKDGTIQLGYCPMQTKDIACCKPSNPKPPPVFNSSVKTCADAGGKCKHVDADQCRHGTVLYDMLCPDRPRLLNCCLESDDEL